MKSGKRAHYKSNRHWLNKTSLRTNNNTACINNNVLEALKLQRERHNQTNTSDLSLPDAAPIPGFSYDKIKQKYFKIDSTSHFNDKDDSDYNNKVEKIILVPSRKTNFLSYLMTRESGRYQLPNSGFNEIVKTINYKEISDVINLKTQNSSTIQFQSVHDLDLTSTRKYLVTAGQHLVNVYSIVPPQSPVNLNSDKCGLLPLWVSSLQPSVISAVRWCKDNFSNLLAYSSLGDGAQAGKVDFANLDKRLFFSYQLPTGSLWTVEWGESCHNSKLCLGTSSSVPCRIIDIRAGQATCIQTKRHYSDILSQDFINMGSEVLSGCRNGCISRWDLRSNDRSNKSLIKMTSPISCLKMMKNKNYLLSSCMNGSLQLHDIRMNKSVMSYKRHRNSHSLLRFSTDETDSIVIASGIDRVIRIWDIHNGELLREIKTPIFKTSSVYWASYPIDQSRICNLPTFVAFLATSSGLQIMTSIA